MSRASGRTANLLGSLSLTISDRIHAAGEDELGLGGSAPAALVALSTFLADEPIDRLGGAMGITPSAVVRLIDRLEERGLVQRRRGPDGRRVSVSPTSQGRKAAGRILERREEVLTGALSVLTAAEQRELVRVQEKILAHVADDRAVAWRICRFCDVDSCGHFTGRCPVTQGVAQAS